MSKTYKIELTELEARALKIISGQTHPVGGGKADSFDQALSGVWRKLSDVAYKTPSSDVYERIDELLKLPHGLSTETSIPLTPGYEAVIKDNGVQVGCQLIPWEKVEEVMKHRPARQASSNEWREVSSEEAERCFKEGGWEIQWLSASGEWCDNKTATFFPDEIKHRARRL